MARIPIYPRATQRNPKLARHLEGVSHRKFFRAAIKNFILLQLLFLGLFSYIFGSLFQQGVRTHNLTIGFVDYDGGAIGAAVRRAYSSLQSDNFPTLIERPASDFPTPDDIYSDICGAEYWATLYVLPGASDRLHDALAGNGAQLFDRRNVMAYVWNEARYSSIVDQAIANNVATLSSTARIAYSTANGTGHVESILGANTTLAAVSLLADPWELVSIDIQPTSQGSRAIYNTVAIILIMMQEFFYLGIINGLHHNFQVYNKLRPSRIVLFRTMSSVAYCFVGSLCLAGAIWAFRSGWNVGGGQFMLTWMTLWLFAHLNFQTLDVFSVWLPLPYVPMALVAWVVFNVTSVILPLELSAAWYRVGYAFPAHNTYQTLMDIWSGGCNPHLYYTLPILFAWEVLSTVLAVLGVYRRSHYAALAEEAAQKQLNERIDTAVDFQRKLEREAREEEGNKAEEKEDVEQGASESTSEGRIRRELAEVIDKENEQIRREQTREMRAAPGFGPAFELPFRPEGSDDDA
ncbi:hypothetical protein QBC47DRAFT_394765 [Echria macrotheca]|uniref:DUF3533 domain-containing protein n=1 Tax=Echria macrotheca TaxID=438768 RepID=A0AAJ0B1Y3_9PEZI|nr:hypothetical protein QBC47DRAFT_394765 [Echria macrotheca]